MYNQVLTNSGAELIRDAINNSKKIVFTRAICGTHYDMDSRGDLAAKPIDWYNGADGSISAVSAKSGGLSVVASFEAIESGADPVKSVCICAQIKKDGMSPTYDAKDDVIFAAWCDDNSCYISGDDIYIKFDLPIALGSLVDDIGSEVIDGDKVFLSSITVGPDDDSFKIDGVNREINYDGSSFLLDEMPMGFSYDTAGSTISITLGDGTVIDVQCTSVTEGS